MRLFGLIGYPLTHSFSKNYFTQKFEKEGISNCEYQLFPIESIDSLKQLIEINPALCGLNVTIPYKEKVIPFLNRLDATAQTIAAVNCIKIQTNSNGKKELVGYNTDAFGFKQSIKPFLETQHERALILGTGGASKAVYHVLNEIGIDCYFVTRDKAKLNNKKGFIYNELNEYVMNAFKLIVNTTPLGTFPDTASFPEIPYEYLSDSHLLYDLVYNPVETVFLQKGKEKGAKIINGLSMLQQQAEEAWRIWNS